MNDPYRAELLAAALRIQSEQQARGNAFRAWMVSRLGVGPGTTLADQIIGVAPKQLPQDHLHLRVQFALGLPPNYSFSEDQLLMVIESRRAASLPADADLR